MALADNAKEFLLAEYAQLRETFRSHIQQTVADLRAVITLVVAFWAWIATNEVNSEYCYLLWCPLLITAVFCCKWIVFHVSLVRLSRYLRHIEAQFDLPSGTGWSTCYADYGRDLLGPFTTLLWAALIIANCVAIYWVPLHDAIQSATGR